MHPPIHHSTRPQRPANRRTKNTVKNTTLPVLCKPAESFPLLHHGNIFHPKHHEDWIFLSHHRPTSLWLNVHCSTFTTYIGILFMGGFLFMDFLPYGWKTEMFCAAKHFLPLLASGCNRGSCKTLTVLQRNASKQL